MDTLSLGGQYVLWAGVEAIRGARGLLHTLDALPMPEPKVPSHLLPRECMRCGE